MRCTAEAQLELMFEFTESCQADCVLAASVSEIPHAHVDNELEICVRPKM